MKKKSPLLLSLALAFASLFILTACSSNSASSQKNKAQVITTFYPVYAMTKAVAGNELTVKNVVPTNQDVHEFEPTIREVAEMTNSKIIFYNSKELEKWVAPVQTKAKKVELSSVVTKINDDDPHTWLSPKEAILEVKEIERVLSEKYPQDKANFKKNAENYIKKLSKISQQYENLKNSKKKTLVTQHGAFSYIARDYGLKQIAISGLTEDAEPSVEVMAKLRETIQREQVSYIYFEKDMSPKIAQAVAKESNSKLVGINTMETLDKAKGQKFDSESMLMMMRDNYKTLERTLN